MDEESSLTNPAFRKSKLTLYLWWALNVAIVVFVFLAFLMSTLAYSHSKNLANHFNNSFYEQQGGLIENKYKVGRSYNIKRGSITSFCDERNIELCEGLGPIWGRPFATRDAWSPAIQASIAQLSHLVSLYVHVVESDHNTLRASFVDTNSAYPMAINGTATLSLASPVTSIHARATNDQTTAVVMYTNANETYLQTVSVTAVGGQVTWSGTSIPLFHIHDPTQNGTLVRDIAVAGNWIIVSYGYYDQGAKYEVYVLDNTAPGRLRLLTGVPHWTFGLQVVEILATRYLGDGYIIQSNANSAALGKIDFNGNTISMIATASFFVHFRSLTITQLEGDLVLFVGSQVEFVDTPLTISMLLQWSNVTNTLRAHWPTNLLANHDHLLVGDQVSVCYHPPTSFEPFGGIFFTYVDALTRRAKIARARPVWTDDNVHVLPSPSLDISSHQYGRFNSWLAPQVHCPVGGNRGLLLIVVQDLLSNFNSFVWSGGYRYAGLAQEHGAAGATLDVIRAGISTGYERLIPGFTYYAWNNGTIAPFTSIAELFTPNGYPFPIGTALSENKLHLEPEAFERFSV